MSDWRYERIEWLWFMEEFISHLDVFGLVNCESVPSCEFYQDDLGLKECEVLANAVS